MATNQIISTNEEKMFESSIFKSCVKRINNVVEASLYFPLENLVMHKYIVL